MTLGTPRSLVPSDGLALPPIAFIGGGNMASAIVGGLLSQGLAVDRLKVVEPFAEARARLAQSFEIQALAAPDEALERCAVVVWAVKPQSFAEAAGAVRAFTPNALHLSVAAGIPTDSIARWLGSERVARAMPNTPALIGQGMTGLYARPAVQAQDRQRVEQVLAATG
ncbi:MAG: NAD(P)-binding domain-containing protein, partial [Rhodoferax sp.]